MISCAPDDIPKQKRESWAKGEVVDRPTLDYARPGAKRPKPAREPNPMVGVALAMLVVFFVLGGLVLTWFYIAVLSVER